MSQIDLFNGPPEDPKVVARKYANQELAEFSLENSGRDIYHQMRRLLPGMMRGHSRTFAECTLFLVNKKLIFRTQFSEIYIKCKTERYIAVDFYLNDVLEALRNDRSKVLNFKILPGNLKVNKRTIACKSCIMKKSEIMALVKNGPVALDLDYSKSDVFVEESKLYTLKNGGGTITENQMKNDIYKMYQLLDKYNVGYNDIFDLIKSKMENS